MWFQPEGGPPRWSKPRSCCAWATPMDNSPNNPLANTAVTFRLMISPDPLFHAVAAPFEARADGSTIIRRPLIDSGGLARILSTRSLDLLVLRFRVRGITRRADRSTRDATGYRS